MAASSSSSSADVRPFRISPVGKKGVGAFAMSNISEGQLILEESPLMIFDRYFRSTERDINQRIAAKVKSLSKDEQRVFLGLRNNHKELLPFLGIYRTNAIPLGVDGLHGGVFPNTSRFNHSCKYNATYLFDKTRGIEKIVAMRDIPSGQEITVNYVDDAIWYSDCSTRKERIKEMFGFECCCEICSADQKSIAESDARRRELSRLDGLINDGQLLIKDPVRALRACRTTLKTLYAEDDAAMRLWSFSVCFNAFQICVAHADLARASAFAHIAFTSKQRWQHITDRELQRYEVDPLAFSTPRRSDRWASEVSARMDDQDERFEQWLWERC